MFARTHKKPGEVIPAYGQWWEYSADGTWTNVLRDRPAPSTLAESASGLLQFYDSPCVHRGDEIFRVECNRCGGDRHEPVANCEKHGACSMRSVRFQGKRTAVCLGCDDCQM